MPLAEGSGGHVALDASLMERFYRALLGNDAATLTGAVAADAVIAIPGNEGAGHDHLRRVLDQLHRGELRTWSDDSFDVLVSPYHGVVLDRWLRTEPDGSELDQHVTVLAAALRDDGTIGLLSIYGYDSAEIARFWR
jgi:hypothetical protein